MHNWRFLLLAFVAVFQPIASFTERGNVDGRQRCDYRAASLLRDSGVRFHGIYRFTKPDLGDQRLNQRKDFSDIRHNEVRDISIRTPQRQLADTVEGGERTPPKIGRLYRLNRNAAILRQENHGAQHRIDHSSITENGRQRRISQTRLTSPDSRLRQVIDDDRKISSRRSSFSMESRRESQSNRDNTEGQGAREIRLTLGAHERMRDAVTSSNKNAARGRTAKIAMRRSESPLQLERNANREMERSRNTQFISSPAARDERHSFDREERHSQSRRISEHFNRNIQIRASGDQRNFRETSIRTASTRGLQTDQPFQNRREFIIRHIRFNSDSVVEAQRENRKTQRGTLIRAKLFQENRLSQRDSRSSERDRSVETRGSVRDIRGTERNFITVERAIEIRRALYSPERGRKGDVRNIEKDSRREFNTENRYLNRQTCSLKSERPAERRETDQGLERVIGFNSGRDARTEKHFRNVQRDSRVSVLHRDADIQRATRVLRRESPFGHDSIKERNGPTDIRSIENGRSTTETRSGDSRSITVENHSRRDTRNDERRSRSFNRYVDSRDNRRDARTLSQKRISEIRENRTQWDSRAIGFEVAVENRSNIESVHRQSRTMGVKRNIENRRATRKVERDSIRRERPAERREEIRITAKASRTFLLKRSVEDKRERSAATRREVRDIEKDSQPDLDKESRIKNMRAWSSLSMDQSSIHAADRLARDISVDSRRSRSVERNRRFERTSMETERRQASHRSNVELTRRREFLSATEYPENSTSSMNWQYLFYMLQGLYLCGILTQLMNEKRADMKNRTQSWWSAQLLKVD